MFMRSMSDFSAFVRTQRVARGITQEELAHRVGKTRRWVHDVEAGNSSPSLTAAIDVTRALGHDVTVEKDNGSELLDSVFEGLG